MNGQSNPTTLIKSNTKDFRGILDLIDTFETNNTKTTRIPVVYFRCVEWNSEASIKLWFKIIDKTKMQAYREMDGRLVKLDGIHPDFRMTIADMFKEFEYIIEL